MCFLTTNAQRDAHQILKNTLTLSGASTINSSIVFQQTSRFAVDTNLLTIMRESKLLVTLLALIPPIAVRSDDGVTTGNYGADVVSWERALWARIEYFWKQASQCPHHC